MKERIYQEKARSHLPLALSRSKQIISGRNKFLRCGKIEGGSMEDLRIWIDNGSEKMVRIAAIQLSYHLPSNLGLSKKQLIEMDGIFPCFIKCRRYLTLVS